MENREPMALTEPEEDKLTYQRAREIFGNDIMLLTIGAARLREHPDDEESRQTYNEYSGQFWQNLDQHREDLIRLISPDRLVGFESRFRAQKLEDPSCPVSPDDLEQAFWDLFPMPHANYANTERKSV